MHIWMKGSVEMEWVLVSESSRVDMFLYLCNANGWTDVVISYWQNDTWFYLWTAGLRGGFNTHISFSEMLLFFIIHQKSMSYSNLHVEHQSSLLHKFPLYQLIFSYLLMATRHELISIHERWCS